MDAHFREYLASIAAMREIYGEAGEDHPTEFHDDSVPAMAEPIAAEVVHGSLWDV